MKSLLGLAVVTPLAAAPLHAQQVLLSTHGTKPFDFVGSEASVGPDLDGDGFAEIAVGASGLHKGSSPVGGVLILSGRDFSLLHTVYGVQNGEGAGDAVAWCGDVDADGIADLAVGALLYFGVGRESGIVRIHSGATWNIIRELKGTTIRGQFGDALANLGDANGDGVDDLLIGARFDSTNGTQAGLVQLTSGADGTTLLTLTGNAGDHLGWSVANVGDVDGDGVNDFAAGAPGAAGAHPLDGAGRVRVHSGAGGVKLLEFTGSDSKCTSTYSSSSWYAGDHLGVATGSAGDFDGDGVPDVWVASPARAAPSWPCHGLGYLEVRSGATGATLQSFDSKGGMQYYAREIGDVDGDGRTDFIAADEVFQGVFVFSSANGGVIWETNSPGNFFTAAFSPAGDVDGDGRPDFLVGIAQDDVGGTNTGTIELLASNDLWLDVSPTRFPGAGWPIDLRANLGPPGNPAALVLTGVNGAPRFDFLAFTTFDATGSADLASGVVPPGLSGTTVLLRALAIDASGRVVDSIDEELDLQ